jgi:hypothetical protein
LNTKIIDLHRKSAAATKEIIKGFFVDKKKIISIQAKFFFCLEKTNELAEGTTQAAQDVSEKAIEVEKLAENSGRDFLILFSLNLIFVD